VRRTLNRLSAKTVNSNKAPGLLADGGNLYLETTLAKDGSPRKSWIFRYERNDKRHDMGLGPLYTRDLKRAREEARRLRLLLLDGVDPLAHRRKAAEARAVESATGKTFGEVALAYMKAHRNDWRDPIHVTQIEASLTKDAAAISKVPVAAITTAHVLDVLQPIWNVKPETAGRTRGRIEKVLAYAVAAGYRRREDGNPARWDGHLQELLGNKARAKRAKRERQGRGDNFAALPYADLPAFMTELRNNNALSARALEFCILTAARTGEIIGAPWQEFDLQAAVWTVPGSRMKAGRTHRVPLCERTLGILRECPSHREGGRGTGPFALSRQAMLELLRGMRGRGPSVHGFRAAFKTWCSEMTRFDKDTVEAALSHRLGDNATEAAYQRGDLFAKRQRLMEAWCKFCASTPAKAGTVTPMRRGT
jgi:integrase